MLVMEQFCSERKQTLKLLTPSKTVQFCFHSSSLTYSGLKTLPMQSVMSVHILSLSWLSVVWAEALCDSFITCARVPRFPFLSVINV